MAFRVGLTRDLLTPAGEPSFGAAALDVLKGNPAIDWEYLPEAIDEITPTSPPGTTGRTSVRRG